MHPRLGAALKIRALATGALAIAVIVFDQVRGDTLLGKFAIWPPVSIPLDQVGRLMSAEPNTFDVSAAARWGDPGATT